MLPQNCWPLGKQTNKNQKKTKKQKTKALYSYLLYERKCNITFHKKKRISKISFKVKMTWEYEVHLHFEDFVN